MTENKEKCLKDVAQEINSYFRYDSVGSVDQDYYNIIDILERRLQWVFDIVEITFEDDDTELYLGV